MEYKSFTFIKNIVIQKFNMPVEGKIIQYGVYDGCAFDLLCDNYGRERVVGYDINPTITNRNIIKFDLNQVDEDTIGPVAFCDIDVGDFDTHSDLRLKLLHLSSKLAVQNGLIMVNSPMVTNQIWKEKGHQYMIDNGFECILFSNFSTEEWYKNMVIHSKWNPSTTCLYKKSIK